MLASRPVAVRLAGGGVFELPAAGKPDCDRELSQTSDTPCNTYYTDRRKRIIAPLVF
jgi:hypothetical protein